MISTSPSRAAIVTAPLGSLRTASAASLAGTTVRPASSTSTSRVVRIVTSPSVPVTSRRLPLTSQRRPCKICCGDRVPTARAARARTSARSSRSARIRTVLVPSSVVAVSVIQKGSSSNRGWGLGRSTVSVLVSVCHDCPHAEWKRGQVFTSRKVLPRWAGDNHQVLRSSCNRALTSSKTCIS